MLGEDDRVEEFEYVDTGFMVTPGIRDVGNDSEDGARAFINYVEDRNIRKYIELKFI